MSDTVCTAEPFGERCPPADFLDLQEDDALIDSFPSLVIGALTRDERRKAVRRRSILLGDCIRYREMMLHLERAQKFPVSAPAKSSASKENSEREFGWRALHEYCAEVYGLSSENFERDMRWFIDSLRAAHRTKRHLLGTFFPRYLRMSLEIISEVEATCDPVRLLHLCGTRGDDPISHFQRSDAIQQLTFGLVEFEMRLSGRGPEQLDANRACFLRALDERFFESGRSDRVVVTVDLDPKNYHRVSSFRVVSVDDAEARGVSTRTRMLIPLDVRIIRTGGREIRVYLESRSKEHVPVKLLVKRKRHHEVITDMNGFGLVFFEEVSDLPSGVRHMRRSVVRVPGMVSGQASNMKRAGVLNPTNAFSASEFQATKYDVQWKGRTEELRFMYFPHWVNERFSSGPESHPLYRLLACLQRVFPVLFSTLDWRDPELRQTLWDYQRSKL